MADLTQPEQKKNWPDLTRVKNFWPGPITTQSFGCDGGCKTYLDRSLPLCSLDTYVLISGDNADKWLENHKSLLPSVHKILNHLVRVTNLSNSKIMNVGKLSKFESTILNDLEVKFTNSLKALGMMVNAKLTRNNYFNYVVKIPMSWFLMIIQISDKKNTNHFDQA